MNLTAQILNMRPDDDRNEDYQKGHHDARREAVDIIHKGETEADYWRRFALELAQLHAVIAQQEGTKHKCTPMLRKKMAKICSVARDGLNGTHEGSVLSIGDVVKSLEQVIEAMR